MPTIKAKLINRESGDKIILSKSRKKKYHYRAWVCVNIKVNNNRKR